jgi:hypothetical protein
LAWPLGAITDFDREVGTYQLTRRPLLPPMPLDIVAGLSFRFSETSFGLRKLMSSDFGGRCQCECACCCHANVVVPARKLKKFGHGFKLRPEIINPVGLLPF